MNEGEINAAMINALTKSALAFTGDGVGAMSVLLISAALVADQWCKTDGDPFEAWLQSAREAWRAARELNP